MQLTPYVMHYERWIDILHVLIIPSWYSTPDKQLAGPFFRDQAQALLKHGQTVGLIYPYLRILSEIFSEHGGITYEDDEGVNTYRYNAVSWIPYTSRFREYFLIKAAVRLFKHYIKQHGKPDIIHAHSLLYAGLFAQEISRQFDIPYVVTEHRTNYQSSLDAQLKQRLAVAAAASSSNIAVSEHFTDFLNTYFPDGTRWHYIPNMVHPIFTDQTRLSETVSDDFVFCQVAILSQRKNPDLVIKAFAEEFKNDDRITLIIGGDGELMPECQALVEHYGLGDRIQLPGQLSREQVAETFKRANVCIVASDYETFGLTAAEALASGIPVISSRCGGTESIVTDAVGFLMDELSVDELRRCMRQMKDNHEQYEPCDLRDYALANFGSQQISQQLVNVYHQVLNDPQSLQQRSDH